MGQEQTVPNGDPSTSKGVQNDVAKTKSKVHRTAENQKSEADAFKNNWRAIQVRCLRSYFCSVTDSSTFY